MATLEMLVHGKAFCYVAADCIKKEPKNTVGNEACMVHKLIITPELPPGNENVNLTMYKDSGDIRTKGMSYLNLTADGIELMVYTRNNICLFAETKEDIDICDLPRSITLP